MFNYMNFSFDFLGLDNVYFKNYFANEPAHQMGRFLSHLNSHESLLYIKH
jgi:hypothetical protein